MGQKESTLRPKPQQNKNSTKARQTVNKTILLNSHQKLLEEWSPDR